MRAQCVLVATTLLHSSAKFHSFLYAGSKTVRVSMESCYGDMSTRLNQRAVTKFLSAENVKPAEIHRRLQAVYSENTVNRTTVNRWAIKFRECEPGRANIVDHRSSGRPASVTDDKHQKQVDELIKHDRRITQKRIAGRLGMFKERVGYVNGLLGYIKVCSRWVPRMLTLKFEVLSHPPYNPDLAPSDFHFFPHLKRDFKGTHFTSDDEVKQAMTLWIKQRTPEFFNDGMCKVVLRWEKCSERKGNYVEK